jgi:hypothetical protein
MWLKIWLEHAKISERLIFRRLIGRDQIGDALHPGSIAPIFKRVAQWIGMPARFVAEVSGHSTGVGAAQDLAELDIDLAAITQAGGWKSPRMPLQYAEKINAARSGMARAARKQGREELRNPDLPFLSVDPDHFREWFSCYGWSRTWTLVSTALRSI